MKKTFRYLVRVLLAAAAAGLIIMGSRFLVQRKQVRTEVSLPEESTEALAIPDAGTYRIYAFRPGTEGEEKIRQLVSQEADSDRTLCLLEINLRDFREGELSDEALTRIESLLSAFEDSGKDLILRFLYDWDGRASDTEPETVEIILRHMEQLGPLLVRHSSEICTLQGLFTGNWGEMNGSRFTDAGSLRTLADQLVSVTEGEIPLAVRTPAQWRVVNRLTKADLTSDSQLAECAGASRFGLFDDGLTGSDTDYGTFQADPDGGYESRTDDTMPAIEFGAFDPASMWPRDAELQFWEILGRYQKCGGEAIVPNEWNDLPQAIRSFRRMHISYLNADYDEAVWQKWAGQTVQETGTFAGMAGDAYVRSHLGCRFVISDASLSYNWWQNRIHVSVSLKNRGFAPSYEDLSVHVALLNGTGESAAEAVIPLTAAALPGGVREEDEETLSAAFSADQLQAGTYEAVMFLTDAQGREILLGMKDGQQETDGHICYPIGSAAVKSDLNSDT